MYLSYVIETKHHCKLENYLLERKEDDWLIRNLSIRKKDQFDLKIDCFRFKFFFDLKKLKYTLQCDIGDFRLDIQKNKQSWTKQDQGLFTKLDLKISKGLICMKDKNEEKKLYFSLSKRDQKISSCFGFHPDAKEIIWNLCLQKGKKAFHQLSLNQLDCLDLFHTLKYFHLDGSLIDEMEGKINGFATFESSKNKIEKMFCSLDFELLQVQSKEKNLKLGLKKANVQIEHPVQLDQKSFFQNLFASSFFQQLKVRTSFEKASLAPLEASKDFWQVKESNGFFSYNPGIGPKWQIQGDVSNKEKQDSFVLRGKGFFHSLFSNWLEMDLHFLNESLAANIQIHAKELDKKVGQFDLAINQVNEDFIHLSQDLFGGVFPIFQDFEWKKGLVDAKVRAKVGLDNQFLLEESFCTAHKINLAIFPYHCQIFSEEFAVSAQCGGSTKEERLSQLSSNISLKKGEVVFTYKKKDYLFDDLNSTIRIEKGYMLPSQLFAMIGNSSLNLEFQGPLQDVLLKGKIEGPMSPLVDYFGLSDKVALTDQKQFLSVFTLRKDQDLKEIYGEASIKNQSGKTEESVAFGFHLDDIDLKDPLYSYISQGWVDARQIHLQRYESFFSDYFILKGLLDFSLNFYSSQLTVFFNGEDFFFSDPYSEVVIPQIEKKEDLTQAACLKYDFNQEKLKVSLPVSCADIHLKKYDLSFKNTKAQLCIEENEMFVDIDKTYSENVFFSGSIAFNTRKEELKIKTRKVEGDIGHLRQFLSCFDLDPLIGNISGNFESLEDGFFLYLPLQEQQRSFWNIKARIKEGKSFPLADIQLSQISTDFVYNSIDDFLYFENIRGQATLSKEKEYSFFFPRLEKRGNDWFFDFRLSSPIWDVIRIEGRANQEDNYWKLAFDPQNCHFYGDKVHLSDCLLKNGEISFLELKADLTASMLFKKLQFLLDMGSFGLQNLSLNSFIGKPVKGDLHCHFKIDEEKESHFSIQSTNLDFLGKNIDNLTLTAKKDHEKWIVQTFQMDQFRAQFEMKKRDEKWDIANLLAIYEDQFLLKAHLTIQKNRQINADLENLQINSSFLSAFYDIPFFSSLEGNLNANGMLSFDLPVAENPWRIESDLYLSPSTFSFKEMTLENEGFVQLYYSSEEGFLLKGLDLKLSDKQEKLGMQCKVGQIHKDAKTKKWFFKDLQMYLPKELLPKSSKSFKQWKGLSTALEKITPFIRDDQDLEYVATAQLSFEEKILSLHLDELAIPLKKDPVYLKDVMLQFEPDKVQCDFKHKVQKALLPISMQFRFENKLSGSVAFMDEKSPSPLTVYWFWDDFLKLQSIEGSSFGLDACFYNEDFDISSKEKRTQVVSNFRTNLSGSVKIDCFQIQDFVSPLLKEFIQELKLGDGYELRGQFSFESSKIQDLFKNPQFHGLLRGKRCELANCIFRTLLGKISIEPEKIELQDIKISDSAAILKIPSIFIDKTKPDWSFKIPKITVKEFRPSLLEKIGKPPEEIKPFVFREIYIEDLQGDLEKKQSYTGKGRFHFINTFQRRFSPLSIPSDIVKRIFGLDLEVLTPICGAAEFEIKDSKVFFKNLKNSFSEQKRSKFFLTDNGQGATLDFDGNLNIHIKMKQYVLFKLTQPFVISIQGNLDDPVISLKNKKSFYSSK